jgi:hypothetical protein
LAGFDKFGIKEILEPGGEEWYMNMLDPNDDPSIVNTPKTRNADGS